MMKLIDFDAKFNKKMAKELERHAGERTEEEWEDAIAAACGISESAVRTRLSRAMRKLRVYLGGMS